MVRIGIIFVLTTPLVVAPDVFYPFVVGKAVYARSIIELTAAAWLALVLFFRQRRPSWSWTMFAFAVWLLVSATAGILGVSPTRSMWSTYERMQGLFDLAHWFVFTLMAGSVFRSAGDWRLLFSVNLAISSAACAVGLAHRYGIIHIELFGDPVLRMSSTLGNATYMGAYTMVNALIGVALVVDSLGRPARSTVRRVGRVAGVQRLAGSKWVRCLYGLMVLVNLWALWLSGTRGAMVGLGASCLIFGAYLVWGRLKATRWAAGGVLALLVTAIVLVTVARTTILDPITESSGTLSRLSAIGLDIASRERISYSAAGLRAFLDRPVLGWGPENFFIAWGRHADPDNTLAFADQAHNKLVEELVTKGVVGLLSYLALLAVMMAVVFGFLGRLSGWEQIGRYLIGATLVGYFVQNLFLFDTTTTMAQFSLLAAFAVSIECRERARETAAGVDFVRPGGLPPVVGRAAARLTAPGFAATWTAIVVVVIMMMASLTVFNARVYSAASILSDALRTPRAWAGRQHDFTRCIDEFPGLANYPRRHLIAEAAAEIGEMSEDDVRRTVELVATEAGRALAAEPQNWRFAAVLAVFYQIAAARDAQYVEVARRHLDSAAALAPGVPEVIDVVNEQERLEAEIQ